MVRNENLVFQQNSNSGTAYNILIIMLPICNWNGVAIVHSLSLKIDVMVSFMSESCEKTCKLQITKARPKCLSPTSNQRGIEES